MIRSLAVGVALSVCLTACGDKGTRPPLMSALDAGAPLPRSTCLDNDGDGFPGTGDCQSQMYVDCNDNEPNAYPGALELCNAQDDNCNGQIDEGLPVVSYYRDEDGDGVGSMKTGEGCKAPPSGNVTQMGDCDDDNPAIRPGSAEICNGIDEDCDGTNDNGIPFQDFYVDDDGDGFGAATSTAVNSCETSVMGRVTNRSDCDDANPTVKPGATELCNRIDDNCDGQVDNGITYATYYADVDGDGFGDVNSTGESACSPVPGKVLNNSDCNDASASVKPMAPEVCNGADDDCDNQVDEGLTFTNYYTDADGDGFGAATSMAQSSCVGVAGKVTNNADCNDASPMVKPGATEICNGVDDDCAGGVDNGLNFSQYFVDGDGDGFGAAGSTAQSACAPVAGKVTNNSDCNDGNASVKPGATELCNGIDDNCVGGVDDGLTFTNYYPDGDGDGYGSAAASPQSACAPISGRVTSHNDCNDANALVNPGRTEVCNSVDDNCNGSTDEGLPTSSYYRDADMDGFGSSTATAVVSCGPVAGHVTDRTDCNDNNAAIRPGATEVCNALDDNCNGTVDEGTASVNWYADADGDGYGAANGTPIFQCSPVADRVTNNSDCNDGNAAVKPGATETCNNIDDNCNGNVDEGNPGGGAQCALSNRQGPCASGVMQCNGGAVACAQTVFPVTEVCDSVDNNCDGTTDNIAAAACTTSQQGRCAAGTTACQGTAQICVRTNGPVAELCNNVDDDCDGTVDEGNPGGGAQCTVPSRQGECAKGTLTCTAGALSCPQSIFPSTEVCDNFDNDCNGTVDNGFAGLGNTCTAGMGVCARTGTNVCNTAQTGVTCNVTAGAPTAAACDGQDNDCDGVVDEPTLASTATVSSVAYTDIEVQPYYYSSSCQGGALGSGTDALAGGAMIMAGGVSGISFQRLNADGTLNGPTSSAISLAYADADLVQAGDGWLVAGVYATNNAEIDLYYLDAAGAWRAQKWIQFKISETTTLDSVRLVRGNGRKATLIWRENGTGIKMAKIEACLSGTTWSIQQAGCTSGTAALTSTTLVANTAVVPGIGADSNVSDWAASQSCQSTTALRTIGISYRAGGNALRFFTVNDDGTGKSGETTFTPPANSTAISDPAVGFFKDASNVDAYVVGFVVQYASSSSARYWRSNNPATFDRVWSGSDATGATAIRRPRVSAKADGFQIVALREFESEPTYPAQLMTRNFTLAGAASPAGQAVEIPAGCGAGDTACSAGNKAAVANAYPWGRIYYSSTAASAASFGSALTCN